MIAQEETEEARIYSPGSLGACVLNEAIASEDNDASKKDW